MNQCLRSMAKISLGVIPVVAPRATVAGLGVITLGSLTIGLCPVSAIYTTIQ
jgi:hypothetical protein